MEYEKIVLSKMEETAEKIVKEKVLQVKYIGEESSPISVEDFTIIVGMAGQIGGQLIFGFKEDSIKKVATKMIYPEQKEGEIQEIEELDELAISAVAEFTNVLAGNATIKLVDEGSKKLGISPPSIIMGKNMRVSTKIRPIKKFRLSIENVGDIILHMALKEKED